MPHCRRLCSAALSLGPQQPSMPHSTCISSPMPPKKGARLRLTIHGQGRRLAATGGLSKKQPCGTTHGSLLLNGWLMATGRLMSHGHILLHDVAPAERALLDLAAAFRARLRADPRPEDLQCSRVLSLF